MFRPTASILLLCVSALIFVGSVTVVLIKALSRAFHRSQITILPKQDYPGVAKLSYKYVMSPL